jgi:hypothetical protein
MASARSSPPTGRQAARPVVRVCCGRHLLDPGAHAARMSDRRAARRVDADGAQGQFGVRVDRARDQPEGGRRGSAGTCLSICFEAARHRRESRPGSASVSFRLAPDLDAAGPEHPLSVVSRGYRLAHRRAPFGAQARQQNRRLDLGARHAGREVDGSEPCRPMTTSGGQRVSERRAYSSAPMSAAVR